MLFKSVHQNFQTTEEKDEAKIPCNPRLLSIICSIHIAHHVVQNHFASANNTLCSQQISQIRVNSTTPSLLLYSSLRI